MSTKHFASFASFVGLVGLAIATSPLTFQFYAQGACGTTPLGSALTLDSNGQCTGLEFSSFSDYSSAQAASFAVAGNLAIGSMYSDANCFSPMAGGFTCTNGQCCTITDVNNDVSWEVIISWTSTTALPSSENQAVALVPYTQPSCSTSSAGKRQTIQSDATCHPASFVMRGNPVEGSAYVIITGTGMISAYANFYSDLHCQNLSLFSNGCVNGQCCTFNDCISPATQEYNFYASLSWFNGVSGSANDEIINGPNGAAGTIQVSLVLCCFCAMLSMSLLLW